jgi:SDR family mycofactocin-dependent oxidoreductase
VNLEGQVALVTGAARGMGRSHALALAEAGADLVLVDACAPMASAAYPMATEADLAETAEMITSRGRRAATHVADVRDAATLQAIVDSTVEEHGRLDIAIANAGVSHTGTITDEDPALFQEVVDVNLVGTFNTFRAAAPPMQAAKHGRLVAVSSMMGRAANPTLSAYCSSKWGVIGLVKAAAYDLGAHGVTVNAVAPGNIATPMVLNEHMYRTMRPDLDDPGPDDMAPVMVGLHAQPVPWLAPEEVTRAVMYLVAPEAQHITGTVMDVSAGASVRFTA